MPLEKNRKRFTYVLLYLICLPADVFNWLWILTVRVLWGQKLQIKRGVLAVEYRPDSWPARTWYKNWGATTSGHGLVFGSGCIENERIWDHELIHVEQFEAECLQALLISIAAFVAGVPWWFYILMVLHAFTNYLASLIAAVFRGERSAYRGSHLEEAAYSQDEPHEQNG